MTRSTLSNRRRVVAPSTVHIRKLELQEGHCRNHHRNIEFDKVGGGEDPGA